LADSLADSGSALDFEGCTEFWVDDFEDWIINSDEFNATVRKVFPVNAFPRLLFLTKCQMAEGIKYEIARNAPPTTVHNMIPMRRERKKTETYHHTAQVHQKNYNAEEGNA